MEAVKSFFSKFTLKPALRGLLCAILGLWIRTVNIVCGLVSHDQIVRASSLHFVRIITLSINGRRTARAMHVIKNGESNVRANGVKIIPKSIKPPINDMRLSPRYVSASVSIRKLIGVLGAIMLAITVSVVDSYLKTLDN
jgi:hypothetical protein